jgi:hypothetical protein
MGMGGTAGDGAGGGYHESGGSGGMSGGGGMGGGENAVHCLVNDDCIECTMHSDPQVSGCYIPCCESTAMTRAACDRNWQNFMTMCGVVGCAAICLEPPKPVCVNGQCVHAE